MPIKEISQIIFYLLSGLLMLTSIAAIYALLRFGKSKQLGLLVSIIYAALITALFVSAAINLNKIPFNLFS